MLVCLREKKSQEASCLGDLLPCDATTNMKELLAAIGEGEGMLIVCDGFDELPCEQRQEGSVYIDLLKGRLLPEATIIVTSRPSVSADLWSLCQHNIHRHLEVIGFTKEDIKQFAESVFSGDILAGFFSYITSNPPIYDVHPSQCRHCSPDIPSRTLLPRRLSGKLLHQLLYTRVTMIIIMARSHSTSTQDLYTHSHLWSFSLSQGAQSPTSRSVKIYFFTQRLS